MSSQQELEEAVDLVLNAEGTDILAYPSNWREERRVEYFYRRNTILTRTKDAGLVEETLRSVIADTSEGEEPAESIRSNPTAGIVQLEWSGSSLGTPEVLEQLDEVLGIGTATPLHFLPLSNNGHPCPATEPAEVPSKSCGPVPPVSDGICCGTHGWDGDGVLVGVVDSGLIEDAPRTWPWMAGVRGDPEDAFDQGLIKPYAGHGTFVAGCVRCVAPKADVHVERAKDLTGMSSEDEIVREMGDLLDKGADVIVCEYDGFTRLHLPLLTFTAFYYERLRDLNVVVLAPAGNDSTRLPTFPAAYSWVIGVGALSANGDQRADFSNYGGSVDVYAPGVDLVNAFAVGEYETIHAPRQRRHFDGLTNWSGTSFSTPLVAGMIAARMSATGENAPQAAAALLRLARSQAIPGVGPALSPYQLCSPPRRTACDCECKQAVL